MKSRNALTLGVVAGVAIALTVACVSAPPLTDNPDYDVTVDAPEFQFENRDEIIEYETEYESDDIIHEDDPRWDCRFDGNEICGVEISGVGYNIQFRDGSPGLVTVR